jgi:hypothetical protein
MVTLAPGNARQFAVILAQVAEKAPLERLDPPTRAAVIMTVFGLVLLGLALVAGAMIGARWVRRMARHRPQRGGSRSEPSNDANTRRLRELFRNDLPAADTTSTVQIDRGAEDTKVIG